MSITSALVWLREQTAAELSSPANLAGLAAAFFVSTVVNFDPWWVGSIVLLPVFFVTQKAWILWQTRREAARTDWDGDWS